MVAGSPWPRRVKSQLTGFAFRRGTDNSGHKCSEKTKQVTGLKHTRLETAHTASSHFKDEPGSAG